MPLVTQTFSRGLRVCARVGSYGATSEFELLPTTKDKKIPTTVLGLQQNHDGLLTSLPEARAVTHFLTCLPIPLSGTRRMNCTVRRILGSWPQALLLCAMASVSGCASQSDDEPAYSGSRSSPTSERTRASLRVDLEAARARWDASGGPDYRMVLEHWSMGSTSVVEITVVANTIRSITAVDGNEPTFELLPEAWPSIPDLFDMAQGAISDAFYVAVEFDAEFGYPESIRIDQSATVLDDEWTYEVREVGVVEGR
jgi:Family of unknown function (DUF6174)